MYSDETLFLLENQTVIQFSPRVNLREGKESEYCA